MSSQQPQQSTNPVHETTPATFYQQNSKSNQQFQDHFQAPKNTMGNFPQPQNPLRAINMERKLIQSPHDIQARDRSSNKQARSRTPVKQYKPQIYPLGTPPGRHNIEEPRLVPTNRFDPNNQAHQKPQTQFSSAFQVYQHKQPQTKPVAEKGHTNFPQPEDVSQKVPVHFRNAQTPMQNKQQHFEYILQYSYRSKKGSNIMNTDKPNQDTYVASPNLNNQSWEHYFGVCDGHGPNGHLVSAFVKKNLPVALSQIKNMHDNPKPKMIAAFKTVADRLPLQVNADLGMSGSTSVGVYLNQNKLYCCNLGDSKAIMGSQQKAKLWKATALSIDHTPDNPHEATRIIRSKGRIESYRDQNGNQAGPLRVWLKNQDIPGLAMTRCFGDYVATQVGVLSIPEIRQFTLTQRDKIIIVASDGISEFIEDQQVIDIVSPYYEERNIEGACNALLQNAIKLWKEDNSEAIDDITFVLLFLDYNLEGDQ